VLPERREESSQKGKEQSDFSTLSLFLSSWQSVGTKLLGYHHLFSLLKFGRCFINFLLALINLKIKHASLILKVGHVFLK
jgi:hypothetical protein